MAGKSLFVSTQIQCASAGRRLSSRFPFFREMPMTEKSTKTTRFTPAVIVLLCVIFFTAALLLRLAGLSSVPVHIDPRQGRLFAPPMKIPVFHLVDHHNKPFTNENLMGHWTLALIGFTYCPDVCPLGLAILADFYQLLDGAGPAVKRPAFVFLSVDPFRDTPEVLSDYVTFYRPEFVALTGTPGEISQLVTGIGLYYAYADPTGKILYPDVLHRPKPQKYAVVHSAELLLINPEGEVEVMMRPPFKAADILSLYNKLIR
jgi:protein SCO1/2